MLVLPRRETVLLSERGEGPAWLARLPGRVGGARRIGSVSELVDRSLLSNVAVLILDCRPVPGGQLLAALGRLNVEYPGIQKVALLSSEPPLEVATYLASCGVDILIEGENDEIDPVGRVAAVVDTLRERARWNAS